MKGVLGLVSCVGLLIAGCNNCEKLTESLCKDLGDDCASWKEAGGPDMVIPGGRAVNKACGMMMDNDAAYQGALQGARATAIANDLKKAIAAKDQAKVAALTERQKKVTAEIKAGLAKLGRN
jgi:hypothetical protein